MKHLLRAVQISFNVRAALVQKHASRTARLQGQRNNALIYKT